MLIGSGQNGTQSGCLLSVCRHTDRTVLHLWLKADYVETRNLFPTEAGTPQGGNISPTLANLTLDGLQSQLAQHFPREKWKGGKGWSPKVNLARYADDFISAGNSQQLLENEVRPLVEAFLKERGLTLSPDKTHAFLEEVRGPIDAKPSANQVALIGLLNPVIRGWANYHRHSVATKTFRREDHASWRRPWQWAKRRHPNKSRQWVQDRHFPATGQRAWTFAADTGRRTPEGQPVWVKLVYAGDTKIKRHIKIRQDANPFDSQWRSYFQERAFYKRFGIHRRQAGIEPS